MRRCSMIKLYSSSMEFLGATAAYFNLQITEELVTGYKIAQFQLPYSSNLLKEEMKVEIDNYMYVIKEVNMEREDYYSAFCKPYFGKLCGKKVDVLSGYSMSLASCMDSVLEDTDWVAIFEERIAGSYTIELRQKTALEAVQYLKNLFNVEMYFDTKAKAIFITNQRGIYRDTFFFNEASLRYCKVQSNTYDLITRLIPVGKNGVTINMVNNGCLWLEDHRYTDEVITGYYVNTKVENADDLKNIAEYKLKDAAIPHSTYKIAVSQLDAHIGVGDQIRVIDEIKGVDKIERVKKVVTYPQSPDKSYVEVGKPAILFDDIYKQFTDAQGSVDEDVLRNLTELNKGI